MWNIFKDWYDSTNELTSDKVTVGAVMFFLLWSAIILIIVVVIAAILNLIFKCLFSTRSMVSGPQHDENVTKVTVVNQTGGPLEEKAEEGENNEEKDDAVKVEIKDEDENQTQATPKKKSRRNKKHSSKPDENV